MNGTLDGWVQRSPGREEWNPEQRSFIERPLGSGKLLGIPGGGKTRSLLGRILRLVDTDQIPRKNGFLVLTFSRAACEDFLRKGREMRPSETLFTKQNVRTVHSVAGSIVQAFCGRTSSMETVVFRAARECEQQSAEVLRERVSCLRRVQTIVVDEAQDLSEVQYRFVCALGEVLEVGVVLVGDPNQNIYQFQGGSDVFLRGHPGFEVALVRNYRSTPALVSLIDAARPHRYGEMRAHAAEEEGPRPRLVSGTEADVAKDMLAQVQSWRAASCNVKIAVIGPVKRSKPKADGSLVSLGLQWAAQIFREQGLTVHLHYTEDSQEGSTEVTASKGSGDTFAPECIHLLTAHASKGLEFDHVLVLNFHHATMSRIPKTAIEEEAFRYLWYVALSRAKKSMTCYRLDSRAIWPGFYEQDLAASMELVGPTPPRAPRGAAVPAVTQLHWGWTEFLRDRVALSEETLAVLEDTWDLDLEVLEPLFPPRTGGDLPGIAEMATLYGMWAEETFYHAYRGKSPPCLLLIRRMVNSAYTISKSLVRRVTDFRRTLGLSTMQDLVLDLHRVDAARLELMAAGFSDVLNFLDAIRAERPGVRDVFLRAPNNVQWYDGDELGRRCAVWEDRLGRGEMLSIADLWTMCLFLWQYLNEARWRWAEDYGPVYTALEEYDAQIRACARALPDGYTFQTGAHMAHVPLYGTPDAVSESPPEGFPHVVELKFSSQSPQSLQGLQALGYTEMVFEKRAPRVRTEVWNLRTGERAGVRGTSCPKQRYTIYALLARALGTPLRDTCWLYDLETTGLDVMQCGVTEIHVQELTTGIVPVSTLVYQSSIPPEVVEVTGITPSMLRDAPSWSAVRQWVEQWLRTCQRPLVLAHNGHRYDHVILRRLCGSAAATEQVEWGDTLHLLPVLGGLPKGSRMELGALFEAITGAPFAGTAHRAAADVSMMERCLEVLRLDSRTLRDLVQAGSGAASPVETAPILPPFV